jgi:hypothetical protein
MVVNGSRSDGTIGTNSVLNVSTGYVPGEGDGVPKDRPGGPRTEAFVWVIIDGSEKLVNDATVSITSTPSGATAGVTAHCPGSGAPEGPGPVFNFRDLQSDGSNGPGASPAAFNPTNNKGVEDCQTSGQMVYWKTAVSSTDYGFKIKINNSRTGTICVRESVSVRFGSDGGKYFPGKVSGLGGEPVGSNYPGGDQNVIASHVAVQSQQICYTVTASAPPTYQGTLAVESCEKLAGTIEHYDASGSLVPTTYYYYIQRWNPGSGAWEDVPGSFGPTTGGGTFSTTIDGYAYFGNNIPNAFRIIFDTNTSRNDPLRNPTILPNPSTDPGGFILSKDCVDDPPAAGIDSISCRYLQLAGWAYDPDTPEPVRIQIYEGSTLVADIYANRDRGGVYNGFAWDMPLSYQDGNDHTFAVYALDNAGGPYTGPMYVTMTGCGVFHLRPSANGSLSPDSENPTSFGGSTAVTATYDNGWSGPPGGVPATARYWYTKNGATVSGPTGYPYSSFINRTYSPPPLSVSSLSTGTEYCLYIDIHDSDGFIDRNGVILTSGGTVTEKGCDTVTSKPFVKVYGGGVNTGDYASSNTSCPSGGTLASWNNNTGVNADYGSSSQINTLALGKIVGFASAQTSSAPSGRNPSELSFANRNQPPGFALSTDNYSPHLGGFYNQPGGGVSKCLDAILPLIAPGGGGGLEGTRTVGAGSQIVRSYNGDVVINGNITYNTGGWTINADGTTNVPSFKLIVTGNIYIAPYVHFLDGIYEALPRSDGTGGQIYTCGDNSAAAPMPAARVFDECNDQLLVHGSFLAKKVNFMRSFGSLRDETPTTTGGSPAGTPTPLTWYLSRGAYSAYASPAYPPGTAVNGTVNFPTDRCTLIAEPADPAWWNPNDDNYICVPSSSSLHFAWTHGAGSGYPTYASTPPGDPTAINKPGLTALGFNNCTRWNQSTDPYTWDDNWLCWDDSSKSFDFERTGPLPSEACTLIDEPGDRHGSGEWANNQVYLCEVVAPAVPGGTSAHVNNPCSNQGFVAFIPPPGRSRTCAAEVFDFSPELYLSRNPGIHHENNGAWQYQASTSLPPVL